MVVAGIVMLVVTAGLLVWERLASRRLAAMARTETVRCADLAAMRDAAAGPAGPGAFSLACEVSGTVEPGERGPLTSELSKTGCAWYAFRISRRFEKLSHDSQGRSTSSVDSRTVAKGASSTPFLVRDGSGAVPVDPKGANFDRAERVIHQVERCPPGGELTRRFSGTSFTAERGDVRGVGGRTLGYEFEECVLRPGQRVYVLGEASDRGGQLVVGKPSKGPYLVSTRSEQELARSARTQRTVARATAGLAGVAGVVLLLAGLLR